MKTLLNPRTWTILWILELLAGAVCLFAVTSTQVGDLRDLEVYVEAAARVSSGEPLYSLDAKALPYLYPPPLAILLQPLTSLRLKSIAYIWNALGYLCLIFGSVLFARCCGRIFSLSSLGIAAVRTAIFFGILVFPPTWLGWRLGQVHGLMFLLVCASLEAGSAGRFKSLGAWIAAGAWLRVSPAIFLAGALGTKSHRSLITGFVLFSALAILLQLFFGKFSDLEDFITGNGLTAVIGILSNEPNNIALSWSFPFGIFKGVLCAIIACLFLAGRKRGAYEFTVVKNLSLLAVLVHLAGPILWIYHFVTLAPVLGIAIVGRASRSNWQSYMTTYIALFLCFIVMGGDMDFWRVNATSEVARDFLKLVQNIALVVVAGTIALTPPSENIESS